MTTSRPFERGPYLSAAFLCEKILVEQDGVKSAIRIIDRVTHTVSAPSPPETMPPFNYDICLFLRFKSGWARGPLPLRITLVKPSGDSPAPMHQTIHFEGEEDRGVDIVVNMRITLEMTGIYWFMIDLDNVRITQVPMRLVYVPQITQTGGGTGGQSPA